MKKILTGLFLMIFSTSLFAAAPDVRISDSAGDALSINSDGTLPVSASTAFIVSGSTVLATGANVIGAVTQSGTWTVQPGNTQNTTAWITTQKHSYARVSGNGTTTIKASPGILHAITVNRKGTASNLALFDTTSGASNFIASVDTTNAVSTLHYDLAFGTALTTVTDGTTSADVTIIYS